MSSARERRSADAPPPDLDAAVDVMCTAVGDRPYRSLRGIDPGPGYGDWLSARVSPATVEVWPDHGHSPFLVDTPRFLDRLGEFDQRIRG